MTSSLITNSDVRTLPHCIEPRQEPIAKVPEILAPVGGRQQFFAALNAGADAVFLGLNQFNARSRAENFTVEDLKSLVPLAHRYGMRVLVTLNILIKDVELKELVHTLADLEDVGVDAIIVQDLGVAELAKKHFPGLRLHASTQMAVHNLAGVQKAYQWGFRRVVLARELTAQEIKRIRAAVPKELIELEVFCHGSLCYSYSGLCFFSGAADARSGNRGECAYTCREPYKIISEPGQGFLFSMRDLDTSHKLNLMVEAGVDTLKIEGRKKDAQYVASVVRLYRRKLNDFFKMDTLRPSAPPLARAELSSEQEIRDDLKQSFQRRTTSFFFEGRYHENVIDLDSPTHHGVPIGEVEKVAGRTLHVRLERAVERFDGLKVIPAKKVFHAKPQDGDVVAVEDNSMLRRYDNAEVSFPLRELAIKGRRAATAEAGTLIEITLEHDPMTVSVGDLVFRSRSADLKSRIEKLVHAPVDERLRPMRATRARASTAQSDAGTELRIVLTRLGEVVGDQTISLAEASPRRSGSLADDIKDVIGIFGGAGFYVDEFEWQLDETLFVPRSALKELKRKLEALLEDNAAVVARRHLSTALMDITEGPGVLTPMNFATYELKIDRLSYLPWIIELACKGALTELREIIFEPKKMYLKSLDPREFIESLQAAAEALRVKIRLALPTVIRAWDEPVLRRWLEASASAGIEAYEIGNPGAIAQLNNWGLSVADLSSDFTLYGLNRMAVRFWQGQGIRQMCLSVEDDKSDILSLLSNWPSMEIRPTAILYKDTPLFVAESCSLTALHNGCPTSAVCGYRSLEIENTKGERFTVAHEGCKSVVYGQSAFSISGQRRTLMAAGVERFRLDFLTRPYDQSTFGAIVAAATEDLEITGTHPANFLGRLK